MSDRLLPVPAILSLGFSALAMPWRALPATGHVVARQPEPAEAGQHRSADFRPDHMPPRGPVRLPPILGSWPLPPGRPPGFSLTSRLRCWWRRYRSRQRIAGLDAHALKDIGVTYAEAEAEANKPFWLD